MTTAQTIDGRTAPRRPVTTGAVAVAIAYAAAAAALVAAVLHDPQVRPAHAISWLAIAAAVLCGDLIGADLPAPRHPVRLDMSAVPVAVGAVFVRPSGLIAAVLLAAGMTALARREVDRFVVAVAGQLAAACAAVLATWWLLGGRAPVPAGGLVAVGIGSVVYQLCVLAEPLVHLTSLYRRHEWVDRTGPSRFALQAAVITVYNAVLAALAVLIGLQEIWGLLLLAAPAALFGVWYRSMQAVHRRYDDMQRLYGFTAQLADLADTEAIVTAALALCRQLLLCGHAHLVVQGAGQAFRWEIPEGDDIQPKALRRSVALLDLSPPDPPELDPPGLDMLELDLLAAEGPVIVPHGARPSRGGGAYQDLMSAPVSLGKSEAGVLVVANRRVPGRTFDRDDLQLLEALSSHLSTVLTSSRRLEQLQTAVAERDHRALHDDLTGLANRTLFTQWTSRELARRTEQGHVAVLVMGLDGFKDINDTLGHHMGDLVLQELAVRLNDMTTDDRFPARLGDDEFAVLVTGLEGTDGTEAALAAAAAIADELARPVTVDDLPLEVRATVGIAVAPRHGSDPSALLRRADVAMYSAKAARRASSVYDPEMERHTRRRLTLGSSLRQALDSGRIEVWFQPVARSATGWTSGCEALLRWRDEDGFIPPSEFIPVAEHTGMIERLTWWTLEQALEELKVWRMEDLCPSVAVNLSPRCLQAPDVMDRIRDLLIDSDLPASALTLEITESLLLSDPELAEELLNQLGLMGVRVAIDDFGTGYSSLSRLKRLPVDTIKIDREFVINMDSDRDDEAIVKATLELARTLGCAVVAEGVETFETWHRLQAYGCHQIQGYILAQPMPAHECREWLRRRRNLLSSNSTC